MVRRARTFRRRREVLAGLMEAAVGPAREEPVTQSGELGGYHLFSAAAEHSYRRAVAECSNPSERAYLERRMAELHSS